jgi:hypothetical protein
VTGVQTCALPIFRPSKKTDLSSWRAWGWPTRSKHVVLTNIPLFLFFKCHHLSFCGLRGPPSWAWQKSNRLLRLGRLWGAVTLSHWCVSVDRGGCSARRGLKPKFYQSTQTMVTAGIFPFKETSHGRAGNRTRDFMISNQRLWPLDHEAGLTSPSSRPNFTQIG